MKIKEIIKYFIGERNNESDDKKGRTYDVQTLPNGDWTCKVETARGERIRGERINVTVHNLSRLIERYNAPFRSTN